MYLLDNDIFNLIVIGEENTLRKVQQYATQILLSSIAAEELITGRLSGLSRARSPRNSLSLPRAHEDFAQALEDLRIFPLFLYFPEAHALYQTFAPAILRIGAQDCRIAAQAMAHGMTVITRNLRDFQAIGAPCEDWSAA
ncbi:type II toxin-antitoxin system VapC family toxin [Armatimonas sp.]|uniref:type II toxin-antitoxin system VapC family toxin n=1 Tax=Armatimonas sp. TaxID=1872638 RepID=UPI00374DBF2F